jgi:hypothetical protein
VLVKHSLAGKSISYEDLKIVFGRGIFRWIERSTIKKILFWLKANQRTELNFKPANPILVDLGE